LTEPPLEKLDGTGRRPDKVGEALVRSSGRNRGKVLGGPKS